MRHSSRLQTFGYWGLIKPPAFPFRIMSKEALKAAKLRTGAIVNIRILRQDDDHDAAIVLAHQPTFPGLWSTKDAWQDMRGNGSYLGEWPDAFSAPGNQALSHENANASRYLATDAISIPMNAGHMWKFYIVKPEPGQARPSFCLRWGAPTKDWPYLGWQFQVVNNDAYMTLRSPAWSQAQEDAFQAMFVDDITPAAQAAQDTLRTSIYSVYENVSLSMPGGWYGSAFTIGFMPEPRGALIVQLGEGVDSPIQTIEFPGVIAARKVGVAMPVWPGSAPEIYSNGGVYFWAAGYPAHAPTGQLRCGEFKAMDQTTGYGFFIDSLGDLVFAANADTGLDNPTLSGTVIEAEVQEPNEVTGEVVINLATANERLTPILYGMAAYLEPGDRDGGAGTSWDTATSADPSCIIDIEPGLEGEFRRAQYTVTFRDIDGGSLASIDGAAGGFPLLENRTANLSVGGVALLTKGLIKSATGGKMRSAAEGGTRAAIARGNTRVQCLIVDGWGILEETIIDNEAMLAGDGLNVGELLRRGLKLAGFTGSETSGVSSSAGKLIRPASFGEDWVCANSAGQSVADFLRDVVTKHGRGWQFYQAASGVWQFAPRPTGIFAIGGHAANFTSSAASNNPSGYPGRWTMLAPLQAIRDSSELYNWITVIGATGPDGLPLSVDYIDHASILAPAGAVPARNAIGRARKKIIDDGGCGSLSECWDVAKSAALYLCRPGRFHSFETYWHNGLWVGARIAVDGITCEVRSISGGSIARDRMEIDAQEVL